MARRTKSRKTTKRSSPPEASQSSTATGSPRLDKRDRQLRRFYEPLVLLYAMGPTRGEHTNIARTVEESCPYVPIAQLRRQFLNELAYMCDYDKGGATVTAIGLQHTPQKYVYLVAANSSTPRIADFLESLLGSISSFTTRLERPSQESIEDLASQCVKFATPRIKKYKQLLGATISRCQNYCKREGLHQLGKWLADLANISNEMQLCRFAYQQRTCESMRMLARLGVEPSYKSDRDSIQNALRLVRHYVGRLGHHFRAANILLSSAPRLSDILHDYEVRGIPVEPGSHFPEPDDKTVLESIIVRMLPAHAKDLKKYQDSLALMDDKYQLFDKFMKNYNDALSSKAPGLHAEIQVLEHFYAENLSFASQDRYIACSKAACFCCLLYFRYHPGLFVEPPSHNKIYLGWRPPKVECEDEDKMKHQRDLLNLMTVDIRKSALQQIKEKSGPHPWHPDSLTGLTGSAQHERAERTLGGDLDQESLIANLTFVDDVLHDQEGFAKTKDTGAAPQTIIDAKISRVDAGESTLRDSSPIEYESEDSELGGVLL